jgi:cobalt-zinc-cadmium efflux system outer membrane protein
MYTHLLRAAALAAALLPRFAGAAPLTLDTAMGLAVQRSEAARSGRASLRSASEAARAAGQLPDPTLNVGVDNLPVTGPDRLSTTRDSMTMKSIGFSQEWVSADKRAARQSAAQAVANRQAVLARTAIADARLQTALAYLDAFYAGEVLKLTTLMEHHAHEELEAARGRLSSSNGSSQEVLALTGARGAAEDESAEVEQQRSASAVQLERWVGMPANELAPPSERPLPTEQDYVDGYPAVVALQRDADVAKHEAAVTATNRNPNWTWAVSYGQRTGYSDMVTFGVSIPIPLSPRERQDRDTSAKLALVDKAEADLAEATRAAAAEYRSLLSDVNRLQERTERYRTGVVTPAGQRVSVAMASYGSNQTSLVTLFEARHAEVDAQRKLLSLQRDLAKAKARLTYKPLTPGGDQ